MTQAPFESVDAELGYLLESSERAVASMPGAKIHESVVRAGGKLIRANILYSCVAYGETWGWATDWEGARKAALALNLGHIGSLHHDDIVDRSELRRGLPSVHRAFGTHAASMGGGQLLARANMLAMALPRGLAKQWADTATLMAEGQIEELQNAADFTVKPEDYVITAAKKTAPAFELAVSFGKWFGSIEDDDGRVLREFGHRFGTAFQLYNDIHDFCNTGNRRAGNDLRERNYTLPVLYGCARSDPTGKFLREILIDDGRTLEDETISQVVACLESCGAFGMARDRAHAELDAAQMAIAKLRPCGATERLSDLTQVAYRNDSGWSL